MSIYVRPFAADDMEAVLELSVRAWEPVFHSFEQVLGSKIFLKLYPNWQVNQRDAVRAVCEDTVKHSIWVADVEGIVAGFVACELKVAEKIGEVYMLAVDPAFQRRGIGGQLNAFPLRWFKEQGMQLAMVGTGGDPGQ